MKPSSTDPSQWPSNYKPSLETIMATLVAIGKRLAIIEAKAESNWADHDRIRNEIKKIDNNVGTALAEVLGLDDDE